MRWNEKSYFKFLPQLSFLFPFSLLPLPFLAISLSCYSLHMHITYNFSGALSGDVLVEPGFIGDVMVGLFTSDSWFGRVSNS